MIEVLIALVTALLLVFIFEAAWVMKVAAVGGIAFVIYAIILIVKHLLGK